MDLLTLFFYLIAFIAVVGGIEYGFRQSVRSVNEYALQKYQYKPVRFGNGFVVIVPILIFLLGLGMSEKDPSNFVVGTILALGITIAIAWYIAKRTDWGVAALSTLLFYVGAVFSIILIVTTVLAVSAATQKDKSEDK